MPLLDLCVKMQFIIFSLSHAGYIYATIANLVITLTSMFGIVVLLCTTCTSLFQMCIQFCISMAVGSLTGDALLHLIPTVRYFKAGAKIAIITANVKRCYWVFHEINHV